MLHTWNILYFFDNSPIFNISSGSQGAKQEEIEKIHKISFYFDYKISSILLKFVLKTPLLSIGSTIIGVKLAVSIDLKHDF